MSSKERIFDQAEKFFLAGKYDRAAKEYEKILAESPSDIRVKLKLAEVYLKSKDTVTALRLFREAADEYTKDQFHLKAIAVYKTILKYAPTLIEVNDILGDLYHTVGLNSDALQQYRIVADFYDSKGMMRESAAVRQKIVEADPTNATGRIRLAEILQADGKAEESLKQYEEAVRILEQGKNNDGLAEILEKILYFRPENQGILERLCRIYFKKKDFKKALRRIEAASSKMRHQPAVLEFWAEALLEEKQADAARKKFRELYQASLEARDVERSARIFSRVLQEFGDDREYMKEFEAMQKQSHLPKSGEVQPKFRQDFEKTDIIDTSQVKPASKK